MFGSRRSARLAWAAWFGVVLMALVASLAADSAQAADDADAAFVLEVSGYWLVDGKPGKKISGGDKLAAGAKFVPSKPGPKTYIVICFYTGKAETFTAKGEVPKREETSFFSRIASAVRGNYRSGVIHAISRGEGLADGVICQDDDGRIDMTSLAKELKPGLYRLQWLPLTVLPEDKIKPIEVAWKWDPDNAEPLVMEKLVAPAYGVKLFDARTKKPVDNHEAVVLVCHQLQIADAQRKTYDDAIRLLDTWDEATRGKAAAEFRRAVLKTLAATPTGERGEDK